MDTAHENSLLALLSLYDCLRHWDWMTWKLRPHVTRALSTVSHATLTTLPCTQIWSTAGLGSYSTTHLSTERTCSLSTAAFYQSYVDPFSACIRLHDRPAHFDTKSADLSDEFANDSDDETDDPDSCRPDELRLANFEAFAPRRARHNFASTCFTIDLGAHNVDLAYDLSYHIGRFTISPEISPWMKAEHRVAELVAMESNPLS